MKERHIQDYLYTHPEILFPIGNITEKSREYSIQGKRIDLLFVVDGIRYIVEIKNVPIQREHIGQVVEYYGLMRSYMKDANLAMVLVSSSIPHWRAAYLEELGIRCVEIPTVPTTEDEQNRIQKKSRVYVSKAKQKYEIESVLGKEECSFDDIACPANPKSLLFAKRLLRDSLEPIRKSFNEYDVVPFSITRPNSLDFEMEHKGTKFTSGGAWWAYRFGFSENMPKNDIPNISIIANTIGLDISLNAELQPSQKAMLSRIRESTLQFDRLLADHGGLWLKTYLKFEHQPRFYHWVLSDFKSPGEFDGSTILELRRKHENTFLQQRENWISYICANNKQITEGMRHHLETRNQRLNLAIRLVESYPKNVSFWCLPPELKVKEIIASVGRMKPLVDFFVKVKDT